MLHAVRTIGLLVLALVALSARAQSDAERTFRKWADEHVQVLQKDRNAGERIKAAEYLGGFEYPDVIKALDAALADPDSRVRAAAAGALWKSGKASEPARAHLLQALDDPSPAVVIRAAGALQTLGMSNAELAAARRRVFEHAGHFQHRPLHGGARTDRLCAARDAALPDPRVPGARRRAATRVGAEYRRARELRERRERARAPGEDRRSRADRADGRGDTRGAQQPGRVAEGARPVRPEAGWLDRDAGRLSRIARSQGPRSVVESARQGGSREGRAGLGAARRRPAERSGQFRAQRSAVELEPCRRAGIGANRCRGRGAPRSGRRDTQARRGRDRRNGRHASKPSPPRRRRAWPNGRAGPSRRSPWRTPMPTFARKRRRRSPSWAAKRLPPRPLRQTRPQRRVARTRPPKPAPSRCCASARSRWNPARISRHWPGRTFPSFAPSSTQACRRRRRSPAAGRRWSSCCKPATRARPACARPRPTPRR